MTNPAYKVVLEDRLRELAQSNETRFTAIEVDLEYLSVSDATEVIEKIKKDFPGITLRVDTKNAADDGRIRVIYTHQYEEKTDA